MDILTKIKSRVEELDEGDDEDEPNQRAKIVIVGDGAVGKTCLFITYAQGKFPEEYVPTVFDNYTYETTYKGEPFLLHMWDTAGQEDYDRLRPLSYPGTEVIILCFSLVSEASYESIRMRWNPEVNHYLDGIPKILVGTKLDMREQKIKDPSLPEYEEITTKEGEALAKEIKAAAYIETSPLTGKNMNLVFEKAIAAAMAFKGEGEPKEEEKKKKTKKKKPASSSTASKKKEEGTKERKKRRHKSEKEGEGEKKTKKKSTKRHRDETSEERKERRRKRKERKAKEAKGEGEEKKKRRKKKEEGGEEKKKRRKKEK